MKHASYRSPLTWLLLASTHYVSAFKVSSMDTASVSMQESILYVLRHYKPGADILHQLHEIEAKFTRLALSKTLGDNMNADYVAKTKEMTNSAFKASIMGQFAAYNQTLSDASQAVALCAANLASAIAMADGQLKNLSTTRADHDACRQEQVMLRDKAATCARKESTLQAVADEACDYYITTFTVTQLTWVLPCERPEMDVEKYLSDSYTYWDNLLTARNLADSNCSNSSRTSLAYAKNCRETEKNYTWQIGQCDLKQVKMDGDSCDQATTRRLECNSYSKCFGASSDAIAQMLGPGNYCGKQKDLQAEFLAVNKIQCILDTLLFPTYQSRQNGIQACKALTLTAAELSSLSLPQCAKGYVAPTSILQQMNCGGSTDPTSDPDRSGTSAYAAKWYTPGLPIKECVSSCCMGITV